MPPEINWDAELVRLIETTSRSLSRLDGRGQGLENPYILIRPLLRREAVASNRIEGTTATLGDVLRFEAGDGIPSQDADVQEILNYLNALELGLQRHPERPLTWGFLNELHRLLLGGVRGSERRPGQPRHLQVVIGASTVGTPVERLEQRHFIPPPPTSLPGLLQDFERWLVSDDGNPSLIRLALMHYHFETMHPYEDGNGRLGRLLITLFMREWNVMEQPLLYLSEYFERHKPEYLNHLLAVSQQGAWRQWIVFFLTAVNEQAADAYTVVTKLLDLREGWRQRYQTGRTPAHLLPTIDRLFAHPITSAPKLAADLALRIEQVQRVIDRLQRDNILTEITGQKRNRLYAATQIMELLTNPHSNQPGHRTPPWTEIRAE
ncbi:MAG: Fic family protein [Thermomicrobiales bacterium]